MKRLLIKLANLSLTDSLRPTINFSIDLHLYTRIPSSTSYIHYEHETVHNHRCSKYPYAFYCSVH